MTEPQPFLDFHATKMLHTAQGKELFDIRFQLGKGRLLAIYGPSGAGKTTLLRILAGLTEVSTGHIRLGSETWLDTATGRHLPTRRRAIGFVFQDFALFPNLTVREQLEYALPRSEKTTRTSPGFRAHLPIAAPTAEAPPLIEELLALMELEALQHQRPALLSGGQQQRVALARAIARHPSLLLLDEPLSALDDEMRNKLQEYILKIKQRYHLTTILVSHHQPEILRLADTAILLKKGRVEMQGLPAGLFMQPRSPETLPQPLDTSTGIKLSGTILAIKQEGDQCRLTIGCGDTIQDFIVPQDPELSVGRSMTITLSVNP